MRAPTWAGPTSDAAAIAAAEDAPVACSSPGKCAAIAPCTNQVGGRKKAKMGIAARGGAAATVSVVARGSASTPAEQFRMDVDAVISGPSRQPGWVGARFLGEVRLPVLSPDLMRKCPLRTPADLERHTLLHAATLRGAWPRWLAAAHVPNLTPARDQVFEHFYFAIQAALEGLGVVMGPVALISDELRTGRLLAPIGEPALRTRGYFVYALEASSDAQAVAALRKWLLAAGGFGGDAFRAH